MSFILLFAVLTTASCQFSSPSPDNSSASAHPLKCSFNPDMNESSVCPNGVGWSCPPGLFCKHGYCQCGVYPNKQVICNNLAPLMLHCNCMSLNCERNLTVLGNCLYTCGSHETDTYFFYYRVPGTFMGLKDVCRKMNRDGMLCGRCLSDHYPLAYSYNMSCVPCHNVHWNWVKYIAGAYLPLTLFYFVILFFKINTTSSYLFTIIICFQFLSMPALIRVLFKAIEESHSSYLLTPAKVLTSFYGVWNLDFFRSFYSELCLGIGILPTLALDYAIAVYPLFLMAITYLLITLHDRNC